MLSLPLALLSLLPLLKAQSTISLLIPELDSPQSLVASIISADATATTYSINCANSSTTSPSSAAGTSSLENFYSSSSAPACGFDSTGLTHIQGPSTAVHSLVYGTSTSALACQLAGSTHAVCTASSNYARESRTDLPAMASGMGGSPSYASAYASAYSSDYGSSYSSYYASAAGMTSVPSVSISSDGPEMMTLQGDDLQSAYVPVVVTAGQQKAMGASGNGSGSGMGSTSTATGTGSTSTATGSAGTKTTATGGTATGSAAAQKATGAAGRVSVEGVVGGVGALAVGIVAALLKFHARTVFADSSEHVAVVLGWIWSWMQTCYGRRSVVILPSNHHPLGPCECKYSPRTLSSTDSKPQKPPKCISRTFIYSIGALALGQLSTAHPTNKTTLAAPTNTTADTPRITLKTTLNHTNHPISLPSTVHVHTNTTTYSQNAYILPSASKCTDLCFNESQKNCIMATYKNSTELCLLHINMQEASARKTEQCPLGFPHHGYAKARDPAGDRVGLDEGGGDGGHEIWMKGPCLDVGDGSVGSTFK